MTTRSMTRTADHLRTAREAIDIARQYVRKAQATDPDPEITDAHVYPALLNNLELMKLHIDGRVLAGQPDIEREATS